MLSGMTWEQLRAWMLYAAEEPFGEERADQRAALIAMTFANANRDPKKKPEPYKLEDFLLYRKDKKKAERKPLTDPKQWAQFVNSVTVGG